MRNPDGCFINVYVREEDDWQRQWFCQWDAMQMPLLVKAIGEQGISCQDARPARIVSHGFFFLRNRSDRGYELVIEKEGTWQAA